ncbi:MAG: hypothetical protein WAQ99_18945 [Pyrinomonadaceae bacterium]
MSLRWNILFEDHWKTAKDDYWHKAGDEQCKVCEQHERGDWSHLKSNGFKRWPCPCSCGGLIHHQFLEPDMGLVLEDVKCDKCDFNDSYV